MESLPQGGRFLCALFCARKCGAKNKPASFVAKFVPELRMPGENFLCMQFINAKKGLTFHANDI